MKFIGNASEAHCTHCQSQGLIMHVEYRVYCSSCGSANLVGENDKPFQPVWKGAMFQASRYTPPCPERRGAPHPYPIVKERRNAYS